MLLVATARIDEAGPDELEGSRRVNAGYPEYSRSNVSGVRFGVRSGPRTSKLRATHVVRIGGAGRNRTDAYIPNYTVPNRALGLMTNRRAAKLAAVGQRKTYPSMPRGNSKGFARSLRPPLWVFGPRLPG